MARPRRSERNRATQSFGQLKRFHYVIKWDKVFGTHSGQGSVLGSVSSLRGSLPLPVHRQSLLKVHGLALSSSIPAQAERAVVQILGLTPRVSAGDNR